ncbi:MAG: type I DNA topoisomerase [Oscillospiraceae bacterium]|nr:type I DNA topoisomerase [Oscillospiraceae bacterium]
MAKTNLVIVESPAKAKTIGKYLGPEYQVKASMGHIRDLPKSKIGIDFDHDFEPVYQPIKGKEEVIDDLQKAAKKSEKVFLATDPDREGEAISWHLKELLGIPDDKTYRVTFNEITKKVVRESIAAPRAIDQDLVDAQQARRLLDRIVGYQLSPLLWRKVKRGLSAGRVQSVATRLVVEREEEIRAFQPQEYWSLDVKFDRIAPKFGSFVAHYHGRDKKAELHSEAEVQQVMDESAPGPFVVKTVKRTDKQRQPAPPFITSTLQQEASRKLNMAPRRTMSIAQQLYEGVDIAGEGTVGLITYMRTDSLRLSEEALADAKTLIQSRYGREYYPAQTRRFKSKSNAQDAHEAIRPSNVNLIPEDIRKSLTPEQYKLYKLIWSRFLACQMANAVYDSMSIDVVSNGHIYRATHSSLKFSGFTAVYEEGKDDEEVEKITPLPDLEEGEEVRPNKYEPAQHFTQPPPRFTEATLIKLLEEKGIGRPSTYAPTVSTIMDRNYVIKEGKALKPTPLGEVVTGLMKDKFTDIVDPGFTANMESQLDSVEAGKVYWKDVLRRFYDGFEAELAQAEKDLDGERIKIPVELSDEYCDVCGKQMVIKTGRFGRFLACPGFPECTFTKPIVIEMPGRCPKCGSRILKKTSKRGYTYYGCERNNAKVGTPCDFMTWDVPVKETCPSCGQTLFKKSGQGQKKPFCINPECPDFLLEEQRPGYRPPKAAAAQTAAAETTVEGKTGAKSAAKKTAAKKPAAKKAASSRKKAAADKTEKPKRQLTEAQKAALAAGREKARANREAAKAAQAKGGEL